MYSIIIKFYKVARTSTMCTSVHISIHKIHVCERDEHVYAVACVHEYVEYVSYETWIPIVCDSGHIGSK